jgi:hypothetical protein
MMAGCGGGSEPAEQPVVFEGGADDMGPAEAAPMEPAPAAAPLPEQAADPATADAQAAPATADAQAAPATADAQATPAPAPAPAASPAQANASETDQLLALANSAPVAPAPKNPPAGAQNPNAMPGMNPPGAGPDASGAYALDTGQAGMSTSGPADPGAGPGLSIPTPDMVPPDDPGMAPPDDPGMAGADDPGSSSGGGGRNGPGSAKDPDYTSPISGANTFLDALDKKDTRVLAEAVAIRSVYEAESASRKALFTAIREESLDSSDLDKLAEIFKDMKVINRNRPKSTGSLGVIVGHMDKKKYEFRTRTIQMRHEKLGWKVQDFSGVRIQKMPNPKNSNMYKMRQRMQRMRGQNKR